MQCWKWARFGIVQGNLLNTCVCLGNFPSKSVCVLYIEIRISHKPIFEAHKALETISSSVESLFKRWFVFILFLWLFLVQIQWISGFLLFWAPYEVPGIEPGSAVFKPYPLYYFFSPSRFSNTSKSKTGN